MWWLTWMTLATFSATGADATPSTSSGQSLLGDMPDGPVDFRCESMQVFTKPNRVVCNKHVVVRRGDLLMCCASFEGLSDAKGQWQRFRCQTDVRAQRGEERMWAQRAELVLAVNDLILTGKPRLQRGSSILRGDRIVVNTKRDQALVESPRGTMVPAEELPAPTAKPSDKLPSRCPIPAGPRG